MGPNLAGAALVLLYFPLTLVWLRSEARFTAPARLLLLVCGSVLVARLLAARGVVEPEGA